MIWIKVEIVFESLPVCQRGKVRGQVHVVEVVPALVASPPSAAGALPRLGEPVRVEARQDCYVCGVHKGSDHRVLERITLIMTV